MLTVTHLDTGGEGVPSQEDEEQRDEQLAQHDDALVGEPAVAVLGVQEAEPGSMVRRGVTLCGYHGCTRQRIESQM